MKIEIRPRNAIKYLSYHLLNYPMIREGDQAAKTKGRKSQPIEGAAEIVARLTPQYNETRDHLVLIGIISL